MLDSILNSSVIQGQYELVYCIVLDGAIDSIMIDSLIGISYNKTEVIY